MSWARHPGYWLSWLTFSRGAVTEIGQQYTP
ncbi:MAG: hypothetical protein QOG82_2382 [Actinomycetota bacterium]|jgi:hypothetical protein|nr:hypothetical protein [Actinomycetota bacterium]